jgi:hypothetical protein
VRSSAPCFPSPKLKSSEHIMAHPSNVTCNFFRRNNKDAGPISWKIAKAMSLAYASNRFRRKYSRRPVSSLQFHCFVFITYISSRRILLLCKLHCAKYMSRVNFYTGRSEYISIEFEKNRRYRRVYSTKYENLTDNHFYDIGSNI